nr:hypothetical protein [Morganella morganii]
MATIPTQNAVPSEAPRDLKFNSGKIDEFVTSLEHEYKDRFGRCHMTVEGMRWMFEQLMERFKVDINQAIIAAGYIPMYSFQQGAEITKRNEILRDETTGEYYRWDGDLPKTVPAGSTPESAGGVGMGVWVSVGDASLRWDLQRDGGDALIAVKQPYDGSVARTQHDFNAQFVSVKDFGGDFKQAHISSPASKWILVPSGDYEITSDIDCTGRVFIFEEPVSITGDGKMMGAVIHRHTQDGSVSYGVGGVQQYSSKYRYGAVNHGPIGLQIGGAEEKQGTDGNVLFADAYLGWSDIQPSKFGSAVELAIQPSSISGAAFSDGSDMVYWVSGEKFTSNMYLRRFYFNSGTYRVKNVVNENSIQLMNIDGSTVSIPAVTGYWKVVGVILNGNGRVSGNTLTRTDGDPFVIMGNTEYIARLNGTTVLPVVSVTSPDSLTLESAPGISGDVTYEIYTSIDDLSSALRVHAISGGDHEENVTLAAYASGKFQLHAGSPQGHPLILGCQWDSDGEERSNIAITSDGNTKIGGKHGGALVVPYNENPASAFIMIEGNAFGEAYIRANSPGDNADVYILPKGDGRVAFGRVTNGGGTISSYIEIKDATGVIRKLAVID